MPVTPPKHPIDTGSFQQLQLKCCVVTNCIYQIPLNHPVESRDNNIIDISIQDNKLFYTESTKKGKVILATYVYARNDQIFFKGLPANFEFKIDKELKKTNLFMYFKDTKYIFERLD